MFRRTVHVIIMRRVKVDQAGVLSHWMGRGKIVAKTVLLFTLSIFNIQDNLRETLKWLIQLKKMKI